MAATLRLTDELAAQLALMARVEGKSQAEIVRAAIAERFERCRMDPAFRRQMERTHNQETKSLGSATASAREVLRNAARPGTSCSRAASDSDGRRESVR